MSAFADLIPAEAPASAGGGAFDDLVPQAAREAMAAGNFDDLVPATAPAAGEVDNGKGFLADSASRVLRTAVKGAGRTVQGVRRLGDVYGSGVVNFESFLAQKVANLNTQAFPQGVNANTTLLQPKDLPPEMVEKFRAEYRQQYGTPEERLGQSITYNIGKQIVDEGEEFYAPNPARDKKLTAKVADAAGTVWTTLATGGAGGVPAAAVQYGLSQGEEEAQAAENAGAAEKADTVFLLASGTGAVTEGVLGIFPHFWKIIRETRKLGVEPKTFGRIVQEVAKGAGREGTQEATEQVLLNKLAKETYDPQRKLSEGAWESFLVGSIVGGGFSTVQQGAIEAGAALERRASERLDRIVAAEPEGDLNLATEAETTTANIEEGAKETTGAFDDLIPAAAEQPQNTQKTQTEEVAAPVAETKPPAEVGLGNAVLPADFQLPVVEEPQNTQKTQTGEIAEPNVQRPTSNVELPEGEPVKGTLRERGREFDRLLLEYGLQEGWVENPESVYDERLKGERPGKSGIQARIMRDAEMRKARRKAAIQLTGNADADISNVRSKAELLPKLKEFVAQKYEVPAKQAAAFQEAASKGTKPVQVDELVVGQTLTIDGEPVQVTAVDPDTGDVTLQDGKKFGRQVVPEGSVFYVEEVAEAPEDSLEGWLDSLKVDTAGKLYDVTAGLPILVWNSAIDVVKAAVRAGRTVAEAVQAGVDWVRANHKGEFDEPAFRKAVAGKLGERRFPKQVDASSDISNDVRRRVTNRLYERRSNETDAAFAKRIVEDAGGPVMAQAKYDSLVKDQPGAIKGMVAGQIIKGLAGLEQEAAMAGLKVESNRMADLQGEFINRFSEETTDAGQFIQSLAAFARMTPQGHLSNYRRLIEGAEQHRLDEWKPVVDSVQTVLEGANKEALGELNNSKQAQDAAQEAVDEGVKKSRAVQRIVTRKAAAGVMGQKAAAKALQERLAALIKPKITLWEQYKGEATKTLTGAVRKAMNTTEGPKASLDTFTQTLSAVLREQLEAQLDLKGPDGKPLPPPTYFSRLMNGLNNPEKYQEVWAETVKKLQELYPENPNVQNLNPQSPQVFGEDIMRGVINEHLAALDISLREMISAHYQALDGGRPLRDKIVERTGLDGAQALELARVFDKVFSEESAKVRAQLAAKVKAMRGDSRLMKMVRSGLVDVEQLPTDDVGKELARVMRQQMVDMNRVIRSHYTVVDKTGRTLTEKLVQEAKLPPDQAEKFAKVLEARFKALATERKRKALAKLGTKTKAKLGNRPGLEQRLIELSNLGALDEKQYYDAVAEKLGLPVYSQEVAREIVKQANALQTLPEGSIQQQRAVLNLMNYIARQKGFKWWELPVAFWYANILSGPTTQIVNAISNFYNLAANFGIQAVRRPADTFELLTALGEGFQKGKLEAKDVIQTGQITGTRLLKLEPGRPLELKKFTGWARFLNAWKYVGRVMAAADMLFYKPAEEMKAYAAAKLAAERDGLQGEALKAKVREVLQKLPEQRLAAEAQATAEGLSGLDHARRVEQILETGRPESVRESARDYALRVTFNNQPYGVLGALAQGVNWTAERVPLLRLVVPFTNIVSNVVNESLNYFPPIGYGRALWGHWKGELQGKPITDPDAMFEQYAKATAGTAAMAMLALAFAPDPDDEDPERALYGAGPGEGNQRKQMMAAGWRPYTVKLGDRYYSYAQTPMALPMAVLGNYFDALRYRKLDEQDALNRAAYALSVSGKVITEQSFLSGVADLFTSLGRSSPKSSGEAMVGGLARTGSSVVVPNALRQVDRLFDPTVYDAPTVQAALINQVPFVRSMNRPALNALGEPVTSGVMSRFTSGEIADPVWQMVARKGAWISVPDQGELTDTQYYEMMKVRGERLRSRLEAALPTLERMEPAEAKELVSEISEQETKRAKKQVKARQ